MSAALSTDGGYDPDSYRGNGVVLPPPPERCAEVWPQPVFRDPALEPARFWLVGAHGGAGVSMLARAWEQMAGDAQGCFPGGLGQESPFVVIVARESAYGLARAHDLITQHVSGHGGPTVLLGLITVAAQPGRKEIPELRRYREVIAGAVGDQVWRIPWVPGWIETTADDLPAWPFDEPFPTGRRVGLPVEKHIPREIAATALDIWDAITAYLTPADGNTP